MRTYSTALANYRDQVIEYKPLRMASGETEGTVKSTGKQPGAERMTIDYDTEKTAAGWKVYDIKIAGVSLITVYRSTFAQTIRDSGVDGLIQSLSAKNQQADSGLRFHESGVRGVLFMHAVHARSGAGCVPRRPVDAASASCGLPAASVLPARRAPRVYASAQIVSDISNM